MSDTPPFDYSANSRKSKEASAKAERPEKKIEKVISGQAIAKKPGPLSKFKSIFVNGEFRSYIWHELVVPNAKGFAWDLIWEGGRRAFGERDPYRGRPSYGGPSPQYRYDRQPTRSPAYPPRDPAYVPNQPRGGWGPQPRRDLQDYIVPTRDDAENTLEGLATFIEQYDDVSVADLHELLGMPVSPVDQKWGWHHLTGATYRQVREGWLLVLPPVEHIE